MRSSAPLCTAGAVMLGLLLALTAPSPGWPAEDQTEADEYTRYELLAPGSGRFRIFYEVTATTPGAVVYFNSIRKGSEASDIAVTDRASGRPLEFTVVTGAEARSGGYPGADTQSRYIRVRLPRPVPKDGGVRLLIEKTYEDAKSYAVDGDRVLFDRSLGIKRNAVVLPAGYELVACNYPAQVIQEADGRIAVSFMNVGPAAVPLVVKARRIGR